MDDVGCAIGKLKHKVLKNIELRHSLMDARTQIDMVHREKSEKFTALLLSSMYRSESIPIYMVHNGYCVI
jgi:hypothetical protein